MLVSNDYLGYNMDREEYYITLDGVLSYTSFTDDELGNIFDDVTKDLKTISHNVYRLLYSWYRGPEPYNHQRFIRMKIYDNTQGEVQALTYAFIEAIKGAVESGMDLNAYINEPKDTFPPTVYQELEIGMLLDRSKKIADDYDISYTVSELAKYAT